MNTLALQVEEEKRRIQGIFANILAKTGRNLTPEQEARVMRDMLAFESVMKVSTGSGGNAATFTRHALTELSSKLGHGDTAADEHEHHAELVAELAHELETERSAAWLEARIGNDLMDVG